MKSNSKNKIIKLIQLIYLSVSLYLQNNLDSYAAACTFGFIFSFIPILLMTLTIFISFLHASPQILEGLSNFIHQFTDVIDINKFMIELSKGISFSWMNIVLAIFIIWMARKLFITIINGLSTIFHTQIAPRPILNQVLTFAGELVIVVICAIVFFASFITRQLITLPFFEKFNEFFPLIFKTSSNIIVNSALYLILFLFTTIAYKVGSGSKPSIKLCAFCSFLCTIIFYLAIGIISFCINKVNYNLIYGVLSNLIILLFEAYIFFAIFMYFAQLIYTIQFFDSLLISELYLLPRHDNTSFLASLKRVIFINPSSKIIEKKMQILNTNQLIYSQNDKPEYIYYIITGSIEEKRNDNIYYYDSGSFFGENEFLLNLNRIGTAKTKTSCKVIKFTHEEFTKLLEQNPKAATKAISKLSFYTSKVYGRNKSFLL